MIVAISTEKTASGKQLQFELDHAGKWFLAGEEVRQVYGDNVGMKGAAGSSHYFEIPVALAEKVLQTKLEAVENVYLKIENSYATAFDQEIRAAFVGKKVHIVTSTHYSGVHTDVQYEGVELDKWVMSALGGHALPSGKYTCMEDGLRSYVAYSRNQVPNAFPKGAAVTELALGNLPD